MAKKKLGRIYISAGVSIDPETYEKAKARAAKLRMGWSEYVRRCLELDMASDGAMVINPTPPPAPPSKRK